MIIDGNYIDVIILKRNSTQIKINITISNLNKNYCILKSTSFNILIDKTKNIRKIAKDKIFTFEENYLSNNNILKKITLLSLTGLMVFNLINPISLHRYENETPNINKIENISTINEKQESNKQIINKNNLNFNIVHNLNNNEDLNNKILNLVSEIEKNINNRNNDFIKYYEKINTNNNYIIENFKKNKDLKIDISLSHQKIDNLSGISRFHIGGGGENKIEINFRNFDFNTINNKENIDELNKIVYNLIVHENTHSLGFGEDMAIITQQLLRKKLNIDNDLIKKISSFEINYRKNEYIKEYKNDLKNISNILNYVEKYKDNESFKNTFTNNDLIFMKDILNSLNDKSPNTTFSEEQSLHILNDRNNGENRINEYMDYIRIPKNITDKELYIKKTLDDFNPEKIKEKVSFGLKQSLINYSKRNIKGSGCSNFIISLSKSDKINENKKIELISKINELLGYDKNINEKFINNLVLNNKVEKNLSYSKNLEKNEVSLSF